MTTINVTQKHIDEGCAIQASNCPIARAINDLLKPPLHSSVCQSRIGIGVEGEKEFRIERETPDTAKEFICDFDYHGAAAVSPFSFDLDIPAEFLK